MKGWLTLVVLAGLAIAPADALGRRTPYPFQGLPKSEVQAVTASGAHRFQVWIAADDRSRQRGLMHIRSLPADHGMLFLFEEPQYAAFWMKNTYLSLDLIFIRADGVVVNVVPNATPLSEEPIASAAPVKAILELLAGSAARIALTAGDRIVHPALTGKLPASAPDARHRPASGRVQ